MRERPTHDGAKSRRIRRRFRRAGERLAEDSSLRDALSDAQAQQLLEWGLTQVEQAAERTADLPEEKASTPLASHTTRVKRAMHQVNDLVDKWQRLAPEEAQARLGELASTLDEIGQAPAGETVAQAGQAMVERERVDRDVVFNRLMAVIRGGRAEEE